MKKYSEQNRTRKHPMLLLLLIYFAAVAVRFLLTLAVSGGVTVTIDEGLYINLARGLFYEGEVLYRNQPISYVYLLYPLVLTPLFLLPASLNLYRCVQLYNILLMSSMVFPTYLLGRKMGLQKKGALLIAILSLLLPECFLSTHLVCESLIYPLMMWIFLLTLHVIQHPKKLWLSAILGAVSGLAYFLKANCVAFSASFFVVCILYSLRKKQKSRLTGSLIGLLTMGVLIGAGYLAYNLLFKDVSLLTLYEKQIPTLDMKTILIMIQGMVYHLFAIVFALGPVLCCLPFLSIKQMKEENKLFFLTLLIALLAMAVSIGVMIVPYRYTGTWYSCPVHTRYLAYFLPPIIAGVLLPELQRQRPDKKQIVCLGVLSALYLLPTPFALFTTQAGTYDSPSLNAFFSHKAGFVLGIFLLILLTIINVVMIGKLKKKGLTVSLCNAACYIALSFMFLNNLAVYQNYIGYPKDIEEDAYAASQSLADEDDYLIVTQNRYDDIRGFQINAHIRQPQHVIVMNNVLYNTQDHGGRYTPFEALVQAPNTASTMTPETVDTLLFDVTCADYVEFTSDVVVETTPNGYYTIARIDPEKPFLKSAITSMDGYVLYPNNSGQLVIFDEEMLNRGTVKLAITIRSYSGETGTMVFSCNGQAFSLPVTATRKTHILEFPIPASGICSITTDVSVVISEYFTE